MHRLYDGHIAMAEPVTRYARSGSVNIAYQVIGDGPTDLVFVPGWVSHVEYAWEEPTLARFYRRLASFSRLLLFDKRGTGLSDRIADLPTLEERMDDVRAVMDAVGSPRAAVFGVGEGGPVSALFAATYPDRTSALVMYGTYATRRRDAEYPWPPTGEQHEEWFEEIEHGWGGPVGLSRFAPSVAHDDGFRRWYGTYLRRGASPGAALALARMNAQIDIRSVLPAIQVPTLVLHREQDQDPIVEEGRYVAGRIPGAKFVSLPGSDHIVWVGDSGAVLAEVEEFLTGARRGPDADRLLATVLFVDIVDSTQRVAELGDLRWRDILEKYREAVRQELAHYRGREIDEAGDGFLATFDGPARAIRCACAAVAAVQRLGLQVRAGLHTGECTVLSNKVSGIAVHTGHRVAGEAAPGEVLVSRTVMDLVAGSGIRFDDRGIRRLKGIPGEWRLFAVDQTSHS